MQTKLKDTARRRETFLKRRLMRRTGAFRNECFYSQGDFVILMLSQRVPLSQNGSHAGSEGLADLWGF